MPSILSLPSITNPITAALQSTQIISLQRQCVSMYSFILNRWTPKHWLSRHLLTSFRIIFNLTIKLCKIGIKMSGITLLLRLLYRHFKLLIILITSQLFWTNFISHYYYKFMRFLHGLFNPKEKQKRQELTTKIETAQDYQSWASATTQLDEMDHLYEWKYDNRSPHYDYTRLERFCSLLLHLYLTQNSPAIMLLLSSHLTRNFCNILNPELYNVLGVGTKQLIEDYVQLLSNCLDLVYQDESIPITERLSFFSKLRHVYGRSALMLSGGATMGLFHTGVMVELVRSGLCPSVISGASAGSILGCLLAANRDKAFLDLVIRNPELIYNNTYYQEELSELHYKVYGPHPKFPPRPRKTLFDSRVLQYAVKQLIPSNATFLDLYHHSGGRIFNVVIHSSSLASGFFVANYLTAPHVYVASAVAASCALPGVFEPCPIYYSRTYTKLVLSYLRGKLGALVQQQLNNNDSNNNNNTPLITTTSSPTSQQQLITHPNHKSISKSIDPNLIQASLEPIVKSNHIDNQQSPTSSPQQKQQSPHEVYAFDDVSESENESVIALFGDNRLYEDGSLGADLPFTVLKEQFGVNFSIVSQCNPHIAPLLKCFPSFYPNYMNRPYSISIVTKMMSQILHMIEYLFGSFRSLVLNLTESKLLPWFPTQLRSMLSQTYSGDITILPPALTWDVYKTAISNPSPSILTNYRDQTIKHSWRYLTRLKIATKIENQLQKIAYSLRVRFQNQSHIAGNNNNNTTMGISSLGSSVQLNTIVQQQQHLPQPHQQQQQQLPLCRIQSSTSQDKLLLSSTPSSTSNQQSNNLKQSSSSSSIKNKNNNNINTNSTPQKVKTLSRRSSFFQQIYDSQNDNQSTTASQTQHCMNPDEIPNVNDADPSDYYDVDCYLYENDDNDNSNNNSTNGSFETTPFDPSGESQQQQQQQQQSTNSQSLPHQDNNTINNISSSSSTTQPQNQSTSISSPLSPTQFINTNNISSSSSYSSDRHSSTSFTLPQSSFYRIRSSFGAIDQLNMTDNDDINNSNDPNHIKTTNVVLLPVPSHTPIGVGIPRTLSHGSSAQHYNQQQQQQQQQQQLTQDLVLNTSQNGQNNQTTLTRSPSDESRYTEIYPSQAELAFDQF